MTWHGEFRDPRLVEVYDRECPWGREDDFFMAVAGADPGRRVLDLGCGTGRLAMALAAAGHEVTAVDPARASLDAARQKPGAGRITWIEGDAADLPANAFDVALMTSHVAQFLITDEEWAQTLAHLRRAVVGGGILCFDTRDPNTRWQPAPVDLGDVTIITDVTDVTDLTDVRGGCTTFVRHYRFADGSMRESEATLRFRTTAELTSSLATAGFSVDAIYGGWERQPVGEGDGELIVVASAGPAGRTPSGF